MAASCTLTADREILARCVHSVGQAGQPEHVLLWPAGAHDNDEALKSRSGWHVSSLTTHFFRVFTGPSHYLPRGRERLVYCACRRPAHVVAESRVALVAS